MLGPGSVLASRYELREALGKGGMGVVYRAHDRVLDEDVAIKVLRPDAAGSAEMARRFLAEIKLARAVTHKNVCRIHEYGEDQGLQYISMAFVEGVDLNVLGRRCHPLPVADACEIVRQAALGLEEVHRHGLVHRDVKPSNLMVTPRGVVKLLDLGLARFQFEPGSGEEVTGTGMTMGTVDYMAPEQIADSRSVDIRADLYSLGCTLYKLLSGRTPFAAPAY